MCVKEIERERENWFTLDFIQCERGTSKEAFIDCDTSRDLKCGEKEIKTDDGDIQYLLSEREREREKGTTGRGEE